MAHLPKVPKEKVVNVGVVMYVSHYQCINLVIFSKVQIKMGTYLSYYGRGRIIIFLYNQPQLHDSRTMIMKSTSSDDLACLARMC